MFYGRNKELALLTSLKDKSTASLVCILGRRRVGKSALTQEFSKQFLNFFSIQGLAPVPRMDSKFQLNHFSKQIQNHFGGPTVQFQDWTQALTFLAEKTRKGRHLIFLDEVSWLAKGDPMFSSRLKDVWDREFKKNHQLILIVCGSVSSWIQENILHHANFVGRISAEIHLKELPINESNQFFKNVPWKISSNEKMMTLSITGGIPKYLEEIVLNKNLEQQLAKLCFSSSGFLHNEYEKIFTDIFGRKKATLEKIVRACIDRHWEPVELAKKLKTPQNSDFKENLDILEISGFLERDYFFKLDGKDSKLSRIRLSDNYLRFYLKYIEPISKKMKSSRAELSSLRDLPHLETTQGFQFENLILNHRFMIHKQLKIEDRQIISSGPYRQKKGGHILKSCQVDLLIHTQGQNFYLCEIKCRQSIDKEIIKEVQKKMDDLRLPRRSSLRPVLIYQGELYRPHQTEIENYFAKIISFEDLLEMHES
jgi:AAA+ ATPase superfamily predicted ATPase